MEYLIHVVDYASQHKKNEKSEFELIQGRSEKGDFSDIVEADAFYLIEANSEIDSVIAVSKIIKIEENEGESSTLSDVLEKSNRKFENAAIDDDSFTPIVTKTLKHVKNTETTIILTHFTIDKFNKEDSWTEYHEVVFYVIPRNNILFLKG